MNPSLRAPGSSSIVQLITDIEADSVAFESYHDEPVIPPIELKVRISGDASPGELANSYFPEGWQTDGSAVLTLRVLVGVQTDQVAITRDVLATEFRFGSNSWFDWVVDDERNYSPWQQERFASEFGAGKIVYLNLD